MSEDTEGERAGTGISRRQLVTYGAFASVAALAMQIDGGRASAATDGGGIVPNLDDLGASLPESAPAPSVQSRAAEAGWGGHSNGKIPASAMIEVPASVGDPYLEKAAAEAYFDLSAAFGAQFPARARLPITEAYRSYERQQALYDAYQAGTGNLAAYPGTSVHGWALACDFGGGVNQYGTAEKNWMNANAPKYGWQPRGDTFAQREAWHFEYDGSYTANPTPPASDTDTGDDELFKIIKAGDSNALYIVGPNGRAPITSVSHADLLSRFRKEDRLLPVEIDIVVSYMRKVY